MSEEKIDILAKAYEPQVYEAEVYQQWLAGDYFNPDNSRNEGPFFSMAMPPPNATGILHIGHAEILSIEDIIIRYKRLQGYRTLWLPGTDHAAIATQTKVEKILASEGTDRYNLGHDKFIERVKSYVADSQSTIREQIRKVGCSCDWSRERYTFDDGLSQAVNTAFVRMYQDGLIYRGLRIVNWCPRCASTLADDEVEYKEQDAKFYYIQYGPIVIATTRPETKLADTGVAVNPNDVRYQKYIGQTLDIDLAGHKIKVKVFADSSVDPEFGTGAIGVTPAHSLIDYDWAQKNNLEVIKLIDEQGKILASGGKYAGLDVLAARSALVKDLEAAKLLVKVEDIKNNLSLCYRCSTAIEPLPSEQWFVAVEKIVPGRGKSLKQLAQEAVSSEDIKIIPKRFIKTYDHWLDNLHDWCISRQIWWGHQLPVWYDEAGNVIVALDEASAQKQAVGKVLRRDPDTLDTWFSSSLWTFSTLGWPNKTKDLERYHPTTVMQTGYDIIFFWVARMIIMSEYLLQEKPFSIVYLSGLVRDKQGKKMSKSSGNGLDPIEVINEYGADALRLSLVAGTTPGADFRIYPEKIAGYRNFVNKLWNIARFIFSSVAKVQRVKVRPQASSLADSWILAEYDSLVKEITSDFHNWRLAPAIEKLYNFTWAKLADWYLEVVKIEKNINPASAKNKDEILLYLLEGLLKLWHPFTPFVTEVLWRQFKPEHLLVIEHWPKAENVNQTVIKNFTELQELVTQIRNLKAANKIAPQQKSPCQLNSVFLSKDDLQVVARLARVELVPKLDKGQTINIGQSTIVIDLDQGLSDKERESLSDYCAKLKIQLSNKDFLNNAPRQVIDDLKEKLKQAEKKLSK